MRSVLWDLIRILFSKNEKERDDWWFCGGIKASAKMSLKSLREFRDYLQASVEYEEKKQEAE